MARQLHEPLLDDAEIEDHRIWVYRVSRGLKFRGFEARFLDKPQAKPAFSCVHELRLKQMTWALNMRTGGFEDPVVFTVMPKHHLGRHFTITDGSGVEVCVLCLSHNLLQVLQAVVSARYGSSNSRKGANSSIRGGSGSSNNSDVAAAIVVMCWQK